MNDIAAPTVTDWLQGWGTVAGSIFSGIATIATLLLLWHEIRVRRSEAQEREAAQARSVFVSVESVAGQLGGSLTSATFATRNLSRDVISDVYLEIRHRDATEERILVRAVQDFLISGGVATFEWAVGVQLLWPNDIQAPDLFHFRIQFLDARGIRWERVNRDQPKRVPEPDGPAKGDVRRLPRIEPDAAATR